MNYQAPIILHLRGRTFHDLIFIKLIGLLFFYQFKDESTVILALFNSYAHHLVLDFNKIVK